jgi:hypothetical protein
MTGDGLSIEKSRQLPGCALMRTYAKIKDIDVSKRENNCVDTSDPRTHSKDAKNP